MSSDAELYSIDPTAYDVAHGQLPRQPAKRLTIVAFDDYIVMSTGSASFVTSTSLDDLLGLFDELAIEIVVDQVVGTLSLGAQIFHSGDGRHYLTKASSPEIPVTSAAAGVTTLLPIGYDDGSRPSLGYVSIHLLASGTSGTTAHVKMTVTGNNTQESKFSAAVANFINEYFVEPYPDDDWTINISLNPPPDNPPEPTPPIQPSVISHPRLFLLSSPGISVATTKP